MKAGREGRGDTGLRERRAKETGLEESQNPEATSRRRGEHGRKHAKGQHL